MNHLPPTMKAAVTTGNGSLTVWDHIPLPSPGDYQALVRLCYGATCAGTDQRIMEGGHPNPLPYPSILGHESIGQVLTLGKKVTSFAPGDTIARVGAVPVPDMNLGICWGGFAEYGIATDWQAMNRDGIPQEEWNRFRVQQVIPPDIPLTTAPMIITWRETLSYVNRLGVKKGDSVLVLGSGANALAIINHCAYAGAKVFATGSKNRLSQLTKAGASIAADYQNSDIASLFRSFFPDGIHHLIDAIGFSESLNTALPFLAEDGQVAVYGWHQRSQYGIQPFAAKHSFRVYMGGYDEPETHEEVIRRIREGVLRAEDWYDTENPVPLNDIADAYQNLLSRRALKYLIQLSD